MQALRDAMSQLKQYNAVVFGVSADTIASHKQFHDEQKLNFDLLADPEKKFLSQYGVLNARGGINRYTVIIGPDGRVKGIDRTVNSQFDRNAGLLVSHHGMQLAMMLSPWRAKIGGPIPAIALPDATGTTVDLVTPAKKASVVIFTSTRCPVSNAYTNRMQQLATDPAFADVSFVAVDSNSNERPAEIKSYAASHHLVVPIAKDAGNVVADHFGALHTPEVWVIGPKGMALYHGAIDDSPDPGRVTHSYLRDALSAILAGQTVATPETTAFGCAIQRARR